MRFAKISTAFLLTAAFTLTAAAQSKPAKAAASIAAPTGAARRSAKFSSVYTDLRRDCRSAFTKAEAKEAESMGQDIPQRCKGFGGYHLTIYYSAIEEYLDVVKNVDEDVSVSLRPESGFLEQFGGRVEWRLADGKPFAVIVRYSHYRWDNDRISSFLDYFKDDNKAGESLVVRGLPDFEQIYAEIDAKTPAANRKAREAADEGFLKWKK